MTDTKLILVGGMSGSGKSTLSQATSRELSRQGVDNVWLHEEMADHPIRSREFGIGSLYDESDFRENVDRLLSDWRRLVAEIASAGRIYVMEGCLYQNIIRYFYEADYPEERIVDFYTRLFEILEPIDPTLVLLYSPDARLTLESVFEERGEWWRELILDPGECRYVKNRQLVGAEGIYEMWRAYQELAKRIHGTIGRRSLFFDVVAEDRGTFLARTMNALDLAPPDALAPTEGSADEMRLIGRYVDPQDESQTIEVRRDEGGLYCRAFWQRMPLVRIQDDRYYISSFPIELSFVPVDGRTTVTLSGNYDWELVGKSLVRETG